MRSTPSADLLTRIVDAVCADFGMTPGELKARGHGETAILARQIVCYLGWRYSASNDDLCKATGLGKNGGLRVARLALADKIAERPGTASRVWRIEDAATRDPWIDLVPFKSGRAA